MLQYSPYSVRWLANYLYILCSKSHGAFLQIFSIIGIREGSSSELCHPIDGFFSMRWNFCNLSNVMKNCELSSMPEGF